MTAVPFGGPSAERVSSPCGAGVVEEVSVLRWEAVLGRVCDQGRRRVAVIPTRRRTPLVEVVGSPDRLAGDGSGRRSLNSRRRSIRRPSDLGASD